MPTSAIEELRAALAPFMACYSTQAHARKRLDGALERIEREPQGHPETITHEDKTYRLFCRGGESLMFFEPAQLGDLMVFPSGEERVLGPEHLAMPEWLNGARYTGAALYRLAEPRVWEFEFEATGAHLLAECRSAIPATLPSGMKIKVVATEVLD